jgi:diaminopimelate decarboxylase
MRWSRPHWALSSSRSSRPSSRSSSATEGRALELASAGLAAAARAVARRWGTPAYLYDLARLAADADDIRAAFPDPWIRLYALKANGLPALIAGLPARGFGANAVSGGEVALARRAGFPVEAIALEGIGKTPADLRLAVRLATAGTPLRWVAVESADEAAALAALVLAARRAGRGPADLRIDTLIRLNPSVRPETHHGLAVGAAESKFGVTDDELSMVVDAGGGAEGPLRWRGLHVHVGSQLGAIDAWRAAFRIGLATLRLHRARLTDFDTLDIGSGFPVLDDDAPTPARFAADATEALAELGGDRPLRLAIEPGRAVVARSGWLLARVLHRRDRERSRIVLDAGMTELIRPALYGARHPMVALTSLGRPIRDPMARSSTVLVDGPICESTDAFGEARLPALRRGDLVAIGLAGAYGSAMASTYNGRPRPPEVAWDGAALRLLRRRGSVTSLP